MTTMTVELRNVPGTEAALGVAGGHTLVVDRPEGMAGGMGLGFNGGQLLALALGGCFCNDLRTVAHEMGVALTTISVSVGIEVEGAPLLTKSATMTVVCETADGADPAPVIARTRAISMVANTLQRGVAVTVR
ncbi:MAG TPA: OsmC family protein [Candidatus Binatia bacterium]|nr:OsmC family protein [Candidatus Binatia bacterium]